jgi:hypothetical protein
MNKIRVYIATDSREREYARFLQELCRANNIEVTSRWIDDESFDNDSVDEEYLASWSINDLVDVVKSDVLLLFNPGKYKNSGTGGRHVEVGCAITSDIPIVLLGDRTNIFHYHPSVAHYPIETDPDLISIIKHNAYEKRNRPNRLETELFDLFILMPDFQLDKVVAFIRSLQNAREAAKEANRE